MAQVKLSPHQNDATANVRFDHLPVRELVSDQRFQVERLNLKRVNSIIKNFDPTKLDVLKVSQRKGTYYVYDGQHRLAALQVLFPQGDYLAPCIIRQDLNYRSEAKLFATQNDGKASVSAYHKYVGLLEAEDPAIMEIDFVLRGLRLKASSKSENNSVACIAKLLTVHKQRTLFDFQNIMRLIKKTWGGETTSLSGKIIGGVALFYDVYKDDFDEKRFVQVLGMVAPAKILKDGDSDTSTGGDLRYAKIILARYNFKKQERLPYKFKG